MHLEALTGDLARDIFLRLNNFDGYYLAGGTALALQIGHRQSVDFDLFSERAVPKQLLSKASEVFADKKIAVSVNNSDELTLFIDDLKTIFLRYPFPVLEDLVAYKGLKFLGVREIAATKAYTIGRRGAYRDYLDLYFVMAGGFMALDDLIHLAGKKYGNGFNARLFLEQLLYLDDIEDTEIALLKKPNLNKRDLSSFFASEIKNIKL